MFTTLFGFGQIVAWNFTGDGTQTTVNSTTTNANLNISTISKGTGLANPAGANAFVGSFGAVGYNTGATTLATAITAQEYLQFTIVVNTGYIVSLSTLDANFLRSTNNAPNNFQWQYSLNAFGTAGVNIGTTITYSLFTTGTAPNGTAQTQINLGSIPALQNVASGTNITIRLYGWAAVNTASTFALGKLTGNDLAIGGTVLAASPTITTFTPSNGCANTNPVVITGTNFSGATAVTFGGTNAASFTVNSATQITATPAAGTTGTIAVTTPGGSATSVGTFTINPLPTVNAGGAITAICQGGTTTTLGGSFGGGATAAVWSDGGAGGTFANNTGATPATATYTASATAPASVTLTLTTSGGSCGTTFTTKNLTVNPLPTVNAGGAIIAICQGGTTTTLGGSFGGGATAAVWSDGGAGGSFANNGGSTPATATYTPSITAPVSITLTLTTSGGSCGTTFTTKNLTVNPLPTVNAGGAIIAICQGGTTTAFGGSFGGGASAAVWSDGGAGGSFANNGGSTPGTTTYTASATAPALVTLTLTTSGGTCGNISDSKTLTVNPLPTVNAGAVIAAICQGATTTALGGSFGGGATAAVWSDGGAGGSFANNLGGNPGTTTYTASATAPASVTLTLTTSGGSCGTAFTSKSLTVNPLPTINAGAAIAAICQGSTTTTLGGSFGGGATAAVWSDGGAGGSFANNGGSTPGITIYTASATAPALVTLTLTTSGGACGNISDSKTLTIHPLPTAIVTGTISVCKNDVSPDITFTGTTGIAPFTFTYKINGGANQFASTISGNSVTVTVSTVTAGTFTYSLVSVSDANTCSQSQIGSSVVTVNDPVIITSQPNPLTQTICASFPASFTVIATGDIVSYQWYLGSTPLTNNSNINGATTATLLIDQVGPADAGLYHVVVIGTAPCPNIISADAELIVNQNIVVTTQPTPQTLCVGDNAIFSVISTGSGLTYQWRKGATNLTDGGNISGSTTSTLTLFGITITDGGNYNVVISDGSAGCPNTNSANALLTVRPTPTATISGTTAVCQNAAAPTITFTNPQTLAITITYNINGGANTTINVGASTTATVTQPTTIPGTFTYNLVSVVYQATPSCTNTLTGSAIVTVNPTPDAIATPSSQAVCSGTTITAIVLTGSVPTTTFNWTRNNPGVTGIASSGSGDISGTLTNSTAAPITVTFTITPTANSCVGTPITATVLVNPTPAAVATPASQTICTSNSITSIVLSSATSGTIYSWTRDNPGVTGTILNSGSGNISGTLINSTAAPITVTFTITPSANTCDGNPITATVIVNPTPIAVATPSSQTICSANPITAIALSSTTTGTTYNWTRDNTVSVTGIAATGSGNISGNLTNTTAAPITVTFTITPTASTCGGTPITATVLVNPTPNTVRTPSSQTICSGSTITTIVLTNSTTGTTFTWTRDNNASVTGIAASGSGDISGSLTNTTSAALTVTFTITPSANGCAGVPSTATVLVNPTPNAVATPSSQTKCSGIAITAIVLSSSTTGTTYTWTRDNNVSVTGIAASGSGNISGTLTNTTTAPVTVTFTITPTANSCPGTPITATILVNPTPNAIATPSSQTICSGSTITTIALTSTTSGTTYTWTRNNTASVTGIAASGSGDINGILTNTTGAPVTITFTATPTANGCPGTTITATVLVNPTPNAIATPSSQTICSGSAITTIVLTSSTTGTTYTWTRDNTVSVTGIAASGSGNISGTLTNTTSAPVTVTFTITPTANSCPGTVTNATVIVNPTPNAVATPSTQTICSATTITTIALTSTTTGTTYTWTRNNTVSVTGIAASGSGNISGTLTNTTAAPVTVTFTITPTASGCPGTQITATVLVNPSPVTTRTPSSQTICSGSTITTIALTSTTSGTTYTWARNNTATVTGIAASGSGDISGSLTNTTFAPITVTFTVTPTANGCTGATPTATVLVNPIPNAIATPASQTKCSGIAITTIALTSSTTGTTYNWTRDNTVSVTGIAASGSGNSIAGTLTNTTAAPITVTFTITPTANSCVGTTTTATVLVNPKPTAGAITGANTVCIGSTITLTPAGSGIGGLTYSWSSTVPGLATVNSSGVVTGIGTGTTQITYTVTDANGCTSAPSANFPVTVTKPTANAITQATGISVICVNSTVNLTSNATGTGSLTYTWASSNNAVATVTNGIVTGVAAGTTNITYTVTDGNGCQTTSAQYSITVDPIPTGTFTATETSGTAADDNKICIGDPVTFTATAGYPSYIFKVNGATAQTGLSNVFSSSALPNGASVTVDVANGFNCGASFGPIVIAVNPLPTGTLTATENSGVPNNNAICPGANVTFTALPAGLSNYNFKIGSSSVQSGPSNIFSTTTLTNGASVTVVATNSNNCQSTFGPQVIVVNAVPAGTLTATETSVTANDNKICAGANVTFTATAGFTNYDFKVNGITVQNSASNSFSSATLTNPSTVTVDVTNGSACVSTFGPQIITVYALPSGALTASETSGAPNDNSICTGANVTFAAPSGNTDYKFYLNGTGAALQSGGSSVYNTTALVNGNYITVVVTNSNGCVTTFTSPTITVVASPSGTLVADLNPICPGTDVTFTATFGFANYHFKVNGASVQNGASNVFNSSALTNGQIISVDVSNAATCLTTFNSITITVNPLPVGTLTLAETSGTTNNDGIICTGVTVIFTATSGYNNYNFKVDNVTVQFGPSNIFSTSTLTNGQTVTVEVTTTSGCSDTFNGILITVNPYPVVAAITGPANVCVANSITLASITPGGTWSSSNSLVATIDPSTGVVTGVTGGTVTISYSITTNGCNTSVTNPITVNGLPAGSVLATENSGTNPNDNTICLGDNVTFTATNGFSNYDFKVGGVSFQNGAANVYSTTGLPAGVSAISVEVTNSFGCINTFSLINITVNTMPTVTLSATENSGNAANDNIICDGAAITFTASGGNQYNFKVNNVSVQNGASNIYSSSALINLSVVTVDVTNSNGCVATSAPVTITVNALPIPTLAGANPICPNTTETYTTEAGQANYAWTFTGGTLVAGGTNTDNSITILWDQPGARTIFVNYQNANGCTGATSATLISNSGTIPTISGPTPVCLNSTGNTYTTQAGQNNYSWSVIGGIISSGGTTNSEQVTWNATGPQSVSVNFTDAAGCTAANPTVYPVIVRLLPTASLSGSTTVCLNGTAPVITFTGASGTAPYTFNYTINGVAQPPVTTISGNSVTITAPTSTSGTFIYDLINVTDNNTCTQNQTGTVTIIVNPASVGGSVNANAIVCYGTNSGTLNLTGETGIVIRWESSINGGTTWVPIINTTTSHTYANLIQTTWYRAIVQSGVCAAVPSSAATITINALSVGGTVGSNTSVCSGSNTGTVNLTGQTGSVNNWEASTDGGSTWVSIANTTLSLTYTNLTQTTMYRAVVQSGVCPATNSSASTISVDPVSVGGTISGSTTVCSGSNTGTVNLSGQTGSVIRWESSINGGTTWVSISNITTSLTFNNIIQTTLYRAVVQNGVCVPANATAATITVDAVSVGGSVGVNTSVCSGTNSGTLNLTGNNGIVTGWEFSINGGTSWSAITNTTSSQTFTNLTQTTSYRAVVKNGVCGTANSTPATVTVNPLPTATISGATSVCQNSSSPLITFTGANGTAPYTFTYNINGSGTPTITTTVGNSVTLAVPTGTVNTYNYNLLSVRDASSTTCSQLQSGTATVIVNAPPPPPTLTPSTATLCQGTILPVISGTTPTSGMVNNASGQIFLSIPNNSSVGTGHTLNVTGVPAGAVIDSMFVQFNILHNYDADLSVNLKSANGNVLNLVKGRGGSGDNFSITRVNSNAVTNIIGGAPPYNGVFAPEAALGVSAGTFIPGNVSNASSYSQLFGLVNGNWSLSVRDSVNRAGTTDTGRFYNWSLIIYYTVTNPVSVVWSPITDLYSDPGATITYTGVSQSTVYVKPSSPGIKIYTATATNAAGCTNSSITTLTVNPIPVVTLTADYCIVPGKVRLTASSPGATFAWSTGQTGSSIDVDVADLYDVVATLSTGCSSTASINVAQDLVINGDFTNGNTGFTSGYNYKPDLPGLVPAGQGELYDDSGNNGYSISTNGQNLHTDFYGQDHTNNSTGPRNFMLINGHGTISVWQTTVAVQPNTTYYFSAWGMSLNNSGPFARLQFNVNGTQVGTIANLAPGVNNNSNNGWTRFYGTWTSGPTVTTAIISITDLEFALGGNDFGLDDISFGTLSTFIRLVSAPGTDDQTLCVNTPIVPIDYSVGSTALGATVTGLPPGLTTSFNGTIFTISGTPTAAGNYAYTATTTGNCNPSTASGTITVEAQSITLTSGSATQTVCINAPVITSIFSVGGTGTGATITSGALPLGVTGSYDIPTKTFTITGSPTVAGTFNYTITTSGTCSTATASGTIIVQQHTITLSSANNTQTLCANTGINNIIYTLGGTATGATVTGLPAGITGSYSSGVFIISGSTPLPGTYNFTVTTTGPCLSGVQATGSLTINPDATIVLSSAIGTDLQTICINAPLTNIQYTIGGGGTGATITGLPSGVTGSYNAGVFTITGTPDVAGIYNYTVTTTGTCAQTQATGIITVQSQTITLIAGAGSPTLCMGSTLTDIVYALGGTATGATLTSGSLPPGITGSYNAGTKRFTISGSPTAIGIYPYTITTSGTCTAVIVSGTITVNVGTIGGTLPAIVSICSGASGTLNLTGNVGNVTRWESSIDGGITWTNIVNTTTTLPYTNITQNTQFRAFVRSGTCTPAYSSTASLIIRNVWTGITSTDWNTGSNWSDGIVASTLCPDVIIQGSRPFNPTLASGTATITNLIIQGNAVVTINNATLQIGGTITQAIPNSIVAANGTLEMNGSTTQTIAGSYFAAKTLKNLTVTNPGGLIISNTLPNDSLKISGTLAFGNVNNAVIQTNGNIVLVSTATGTARVADITNNITNTGNSFSGKVTVERFFPGKRSWRLITSPLSSTGNVFDTWQNGGNYIPGRGMFVTSPTVTGANGMDYSVFANFSMKTYADNTGAYIDVQNTKTQILSPRAGTPANIGYLTFIRGDRNRNPDNTVVPNTNNTTLSSFGNLQINTQTFSYPTATIGWFPLVGNPYASSVDFRKLTMTNVNPLKFYIYDPNLGTLGGFVTMDDFFNTGTFTATPPVSTQGSYIQSSQAFFVEVTGSGGASVSFDENDKSTDYNPSLFKPATPLGHRQSFATNLFHLNANSTTLMLDGTLAQFDNNFNDKVDIQDALKVTNITENICLLRYSRILSIERRPLLSANDTLYLRLTKTTRRSYRFEFIPTNLDPTLTAILEDSYTGAKIPVSVTDKSVHDFVVNADASSASPTRFMIVFKQVIPPPLPVTYQQIRAYQKAADIAIEWTVKNELDVSRYEVEKSLDGVNFIKVNTTMATGANNSNNIIYNWLDQNAVNGNNFYRVRSVDSDGQYQYSRQVVVQITNGPGGIRIYPNPVSNGIIGVEFKNMATGLYKTRLINELGQTVLIKNINHASGTSMENITPDYRLISGIYQLEITAPDKIITTVKVIVK